MKTFPWCQLPLQSCQKNMNKVSAAVGWPQFPLVSVFFLLIALMFKKSYFHDCCAVLTNHPTVPGVAPPCPAFLCWSIFTLSYLSSLEMQYFSGNKGSHECSYPLSQESLCCSPTEFDSYHHYRGTQIFCNFFIFKMVIIFFLICIWLAVNC